ncbi:hypothetical protein KYN89_02370 [Alteriqipengyuania sp. NZ-12B]|uniref:Transposase n=1 Tax=Alteriqipengyuania abyssalis TaxID=2860200 RepID=A0ABS7P9Z2_9SPHN|nr:hypothetical protein [Alteriqipengyuania abyssalis]MBY8335885.1 hypothetical protein [Alteriqipengyuania abyssalis]
MSRADDMERLRALALGLLVKGEGINRRSGSFLGQLVGEPCPLSVKQYDWLEKIAQRAGMTDEFERVGDVAQ